MKKIGLFLIVIVLMFSITACGSSIKISSDSRLSNSSGELSGITIKSNKHPDSEYVEVRGKIKALRDIDRDFQIYITITKKISGSSNAYELPLICLVIILPC